MSLDTMHRLSARPLPRAALTLTLALMLAACNGSAGQKAGSGDGPTGSAGSSNERGAATNGGPATQ